MFSPKIAILATVGMCIVLGAVLLSIQGAGAGATPAIAAPLGSSGPAVPQSNTKASTSAAAQTIGSATLSLSSVAKASSIDDADNVRWSLMRTTGDTGGVYSSKSGVDWVALRQVTRSGSFSLAAGSTWSFNATFQEGVGYKQASGVLAGGQCALATVIRGAAIRAGLPNKAKPHRYAIPGFALADSVNIWWGRDDLTVQNPGAQALTIAWELTPQAVTVKILQ